MQKVQAELQQILRLYKDLDAKEVLDRKKRWKSEELTTLRSKFKWLSLNVINSERKCVVLTLDGIETPIEILNDDILTKFNLNDIITINIRDCRYAKN